MGLLYGEDRKADALLCPDPHLTSMLFAAHGDIHWRDDSALYFFFGNQHRNWTYGIVTQHYAHTQHYTPALSCRFTCMCLNTFDSRLKGVKHDPFIPLWIKRECWCQQFYSDNSGDADPLSENASIESGTPRYFQADNLYRIAVTEVVYEHHFL